MKFQQSQVKGNNAIFFRLWIKKTTSKIYAHSCEVEESES